MSEAITMAQLDKHGVELGDIEDIVNHTLATDKKSEVRIRLWQTINSEDEITDRHLSVTIKTKQQADAGIYVKMMGMDFPIEAIVLFSTHNLSSERVTAYIDRMLCNNDRDRLQYEMHQRLQ